VAIWLSGNMLVSINFQILHWVRLVIACVIIYRQVNHFKCCQSCR